LQQEKYIALIIEKTTKKTTTNMSTLSDSTSDSSDRVRTQDGAVVTVAENTSNSSYLQEDNNDTLSVNSLDTELVPISTTNVPNCDPGSSSFSAQETHYIAHTVSVTSGCSKRHDSQAAAAARPGLQNLTAPIMPTSSPNNITSVFHRESFGLEMRNLHVPGHCGQQEQKHSTQQSECQQLLLDSALLTGVEYQSWREDDDSSDDDQPELFRIHMHSDPASKSGPGRVFIRHSAAKQEHSYISQTLFGDVNGSYHTWIKFYTSKPTYAWFVAIMIFAYIAIYLFSRFSSVVYLLLLLPGTAIILVELSRMDRHLLLWLYRDHFDVWFLQLTLLVHVLAGIVSVVNRDTESYADREWERTRALFFSFPAFWLCTAWVLNLDAATRMSRRIRQLSVVVVALLLCQVVHRNLFIDSVVTDPVRYTVGRLSFTAYAVYISAVTPLAVYLIKYAVVMLLYPKRLAVIQTDVLVEVATSPDQLALRQHNLTRVECAEVALSFEKMESEDYGDIENDKEYDYEQLGSTHTHYVALNDDHYHDSDVPAPSHVIGTDNSPACSFRDNSGQDMCNQRLHLRPWLTSSTQRQRPISMTLWLWLGAFSASKWLPIVSITAGIAASVCAFLDWSNAIAATLLLLSGIVIIICHVALLERTVASILLHTFTAWFVAAQSLILTVATAFMLHKSKADASEESVSTYDITSLSMINVGSILVITLLDAMPLLSHPAKMSYIVLSTVHAAVQLIMTVGSSGAFDVKHSNSVCIWICTDTLSLRTSALLNMLFFFVKMSVKSVLHPNIMMLAGTAMEVDGRRIG
jgi:hypothetical protein